MCASACSVSSCSASAKVRIVAQAPGGGRAFHTLSCDRHHVGARADIRALGLTIVRVVQVVTARALVHVPEAS